MTEIWTCIDQSERVSESQLSLENFGSTQAIFEIKIIEFIALMHLNRCVECRRMDEESDTKKNIHGAKI